MDETWRLQARCRGTDPEFFYPRPGDLSALQDACRFCAQCPVIDECLKWVLDVEHGRGKEGRYGVFGGLTSGQRHEVYRRERKRASAA